MRKLFQKHALRLLLIAAALFLFTGCEEFKEALTADLQSDDPTSEEYEPKFVVGVFSIVDYPRAEELEKRIESLDGRSVVVNTNQNFSSKNLKDVRVIARPGNPEVCDLQFRVDRRGKALWHMLAGRFRGEEVVLAVDGLYAARFVPEMPEKENSEWVTLRVGIDHYTAKGMAKYAKKNYEHYNPDTVGFFNSLFQKK